MNEDHLEIEITEENLIESFHDIKSLNTVNDNFTMSTSCLLDTNSSNKIPSSNTENINQSYKSITICCICKTEIDTSKLVSCHKCSDAYHIFCLKFPLENIPLYDWLCNSCELKDFHESCRRGIGSYTHMKASVTGKDVIISRTQNQKDKITTTKRIKMNTSNQENDMNDEEKKIISNELISFPKDIKNRGRRRHPVLNLSNASEELLNNQSYNNILNSTEQMVIKKDYIASCEKCGKQFRSQSGLIGHKEEASVCQLRAQQLINRDLRIKRKKSDDFYAIFPRKKAHTDKPFSMGEIITNISDIMDTSIRDSMQSHESLYNINNTIINSKCSKCFLIHNRQDSIQCDHCKSTTHISCLKPPLTTIPKYPWLCMECIQKYNNEFKVQKNCKVYIDQPLYRRTCETCGFTFKTRWGYSIHSKNQGSCLKNIEKFKLKDKILTKDQTSRIGDDEINAALDIKDTTEPISLILQTDKQIIEKSRRQNLTCNRCGFTFKTRWGYRMHEKNLLSCDKNIKRGGKVIDRQERSTELKNNIDEKEGRVIGVNDDVEDDDEVVVHSGNAQDIALIVFGSVVPSSLTPNTRAHQDDRLSTSSQHPSSEQLSINEDICTVCESDINFMELIRCNKCKGPYHAYCLSHEFTELTKSSWLCKSCNECKIIEEADNKSNSISNGCIQYACEICGKILKTRWGITLHTAKPDACKQRVERALQIHMKLNNKSDASIVHDNEDEFGEDSSISEHDIMRFSDSIDIHDDESCTNTCNLCCICHFDIDLSTLLTCNICAGRFHRSCIDLSSNSTYSGDWICFNCKSKVNVSSSQNEGNECEKHYRSSDEKVDQKRFVRTCETCGSHFRTQQGLKSHLSKQSSCEKKYQRKIRRDSKLKKAIEEATLWSKTVAGSQKQLKANAAIDTSRDAGRWVDKL